MRTAEVEVPEGGVRPEGVSQRPRPLRPDHVVWEGGWVYFPLNLDLGPIHLSMNLTTAHVLAFWVILWVL